MYSPRFRFYYDQLPDDAQRSAYEEIERNVAQGVREFDVHIPQIKLPEGKNLYYLLELVYNDHPEFFAFYPEPSRIVSYFGMRHHVTAFYRYDASGRERCLETMERRVDTILREIFPDGVDACTALDREKRIFDWITANVHYNDDIVQDGVSMSEQMATEAWSAFGALVQREAVCHGIACAFKLLCDRADLPCLVVIGNTPQGRHAWNIVGIHGKFYHVDCTWDLRASICTDVPFMRYRYFNLPDQIMGRDHQPECDFLPVCGSLQYNPFRMRKLCAFAPEEIAPLVVAQMQKGERRVGVMCLGFQPTERIMKVATEQLNQHGFRGINYYYSDKDGFVGFVLL